MRSLLYAVPAVLLIVILSTVWADPAIRTPAKPAPQEDTLWSIGTPDASSMEFGPGSAESMTFTVGEDEVSDDFPHHQDGSTAPGADPQRRPYRIEFTLDEAPSGLHTLDLHLIYSSGAPRQIEVAVNGRRGIFPVRRSEKRDLNGGEANAMLLADQDLSVPVDGAWLQEGRNEVEIVPLGTGSLDYDALSLSRGGVEVDLTPRLRPTIFYKRRGTDLKELVELAVPFREPFESGSAHLEWGGGAEEIELESSYDFGVLTDSVELPAPDGPSAGRAEVTLDGQTRSYEEELEPAKKWKFFVAPKVHNDVGYTDLQAHVNELDNRNSDQVLEILSEYPFYTFNWEAGWLVDNYLEHRTREHRELFLEMAQRGRAQIDALYLNLLTGLASGEELYRATYFAHNLHRKYGTNFDWASLTDAPSHSWFLPTLLRDVGVKGFSVGSNQTRAPILRFSDLNEQSPFWWEGMNGERVLKWYARSYVQWKRLTGPGSLGAATNFDYLETSVPQFLVRYQREEYAPDAVMIYGAYVDNAAVPETGGAPLVEEWNEKYTYPELRVTSDQAYFDYVKEHFGDDLPVYRGGAGAYWEDGAASSAKATRLNQHTQEILPVAETVASFGSIFQPKHRYQIEDYRKAWKKVMFYDEHTWGAFNSISQPGREFVERQWEVKKSYATEANLSARTLLTRAFNRFAQNVGVEGDTYFAFNWQNYARSEPLTAELNDGQYLVDIATGEPVRYEVLADTNGYRRMRFMAEDVPPMGYRGYRVENLEDPPSGLHPETREEGWTVENEHYRLEVDSETGGIAELVDKETGRQLVDEEADYTLNEYLYVTGGEGTQVLNHGFGTPPADLTVHEPEDVELVSNVSSAVGDRIVVEMSSVNTPTIRTEYRLYDAIKRLDVRNEFTKRATRDKEAVYFAYPFATESESPHVEYQIQNGWLTPNEDQLPGAAREWFTTQNLVHVEDERTDVAFSTPDAPLITLTDINRGEWPTHLPITNGHVYSYVLNNYWFTNYRASQGGDFTFSYSITSGSELTRQELARFDAETRRPVLGYPFLSSFSASVEASDRPLDPASQSLLQIDDPNLQVVGLKRAEDGAGWILRLKEVAGRSGTATLEAPVLAIEEAYLANGVEENQRSLESSSHTVTIPYEPNRFVTIRIRARSDLDRPNGFEP